MQEQMHVLKDREAWEQQEPRAGRSRVAKESLVSSPAAAGGESMRRGVEPV